MEERDPKPNRALGLYLAYFALSMISQRTTVFSLGGRRKRIYS
jgi:hypothetical protein